MLFFGVFLRETTCTAAKSRTNLSTHSIKATKGLDRLAPKLAHMCRFICECIKKNTPNKLPLDTQGALGGFTGSTIQVLGSCHTAGPIGTNFG